MCDAVRKHSTTRSYLTLPFAGGSNSAPGLVLHLQGVDEGVALRSREIGLRLLAKVELHCAVLDQDVWEEGAPRQLFLGGAECHAQHVAILGVGHLHLLVTVKVLREEMMVVMFGTLQLEKQASFSN